MQRFTTLQSSIFLMFSFSKTCFFLKKLKRHLILTSIVEVLGIFGSVNVFCDPPLIDSWEDVPVEASTWQGSAQKRRPTADLGGARWMMERDGFGGSCVLFQLLL